MNNDDSIPFGTPPVSFMQTGNQVFETSGTSGPSDFGTTEMSPIPDPFATVPGLPDLTPPAPTNQNGQAKYNIFDLFWMINPKLYTPTKPTPQEAQFAIISFNIDFNNLRISYFNIPENAIQGNIVYYENLKRLVAGTVYPSSAFNIHNSPAVATTCLEQLFRQIPGANWQQERPVCKAQKNDNLLRFTIADPKNGTYFYDFTGWQYNAFLHACKFAFTKGFELTARNK